MKKSLSLFREFPFKCHLEYISNFVFWVCVRSSFSHYSLHHIKDDCQVATFSLVHHVADTIRHGMLVRFCVVLYLHRLYFRSSFWLCRTGFAQTDHIGRRARLCDAFLNLSPDFGKWTALDLLAADYYLVADYHLAVNYCCSCSVQTDFGNLKFQIK